MDEIDTCITNEKIFHVHKAFDNRHADMRDFPCTAFWKKLSAWRGRLQKINFCHKKEYINGEKAKMIETTFLSCLSAGWVNKKANCNAVTGQSLRYE